MAEGFAVTEYVTELRLPDVEGKKLWLIRLPRQITASRLDGATVKLPYRKGREGKVLGKVKAHNDSDERRHRRPGNADLVLRAADVSESRGFRALFSTADDAVLAPAAPFAGQLNLSQECSGSNTLEDNGDAVAVGFLDPYGGRPQLEGMRVRAKLVGSGSEYKRLQVPDESDACTSPSLTPDHRRDPRSGAERVDDAALKSIRQDKSQSLSSAPSSKKKKKRKSIAGGVVIHDEAGVSVTGAARKSNKRGRLSL